MMIYNFYKDDLKTMNHVRFLAWNNKLKHRKSFKKAISKELMPVAWHPQDGGIGACQNMRKKNIRTFSKTKIICIYT